MKTVILCGGLGTRLAEETHVKPKPMVEIGGKPILWHIMKIYSRFNCKDFVLPLGYKAEVIKDYFLNYHALSSDLTVNLSNGKSDFVTPVMEDWMVQMYNTGDQTLTGGRLKRLEHHVRPSGTFMLTYGDAVANVNIEELIAFHRAHGKIATVTAVRPSARFGTMEFDHDRVTAFTEKSQTNTGWINGGFFVFEPEIFDYLQDDSTILERSPLEKLAANGELFSYKHRGFWQCMDTIRDKNYLQELCCGDKLPWLTSYTDALSKKKEEAFA